MRYPTIARKRERLVRGIRIEVLLLPGAILKQKEERKVLKGFSSGTIPDRILVVISFQESSNSSIWDKLNFENNKYTTVGLSHLGWIKGRKQEKPHNKNKKHNI